MNRYRLEHSASFYLVFGIFSDNILSPEQQAPFLGTTEPSRIMWKGCKKSGGGPGSKGGGKGNKVGQGEGEVVAEAAMDAMGEPVRA